MGFKSMFEGAGEKKKKFSIGGNIESKLYKEVRGAMGKDLEDEAKKQQKKQKMEIKRQRIIEQTRKAEAESEVSLRRHRMQSRQYGRRSLLGG